MEADDLEAVAALGVEESVRKVFVSSLSLPTFLVQLMGYLPFSFDKTQNSLRLKVFSFPTLSLAFHVSFSVTWVAFYMFHAQDFAKIVGTQSNTEKSSTTLQLSYTGNLLLATVSPFAIRIGCFLKHKEITAFYDHLIHTVSSLLFEGIRRNVGDDYLRWMKEIHGEMRAVWITTGVTSLLNAYGFIIVLYYVIFSPIRGEYDTFGWKWFGGVSIVVASGLIVLYAALLVWLSKVVGLIRLGFRALEQQFEVKDVQLLSWEMKLLKQKESLEVFKTEIGFQNSPQDFMRKFAELKELVNTVNSIFAIPIVVSLGGIVGSGIVYEFIWLNIWGIYDTMPLSAFIMTSSVMSSMILHCAANFWSICNASQKLGEQANGCLRQLMKLDWDAHSLGSQHKMQIFYQQNLESPTLISPGNYFDLTRKTLTSVLAVLVTYVIVLLQFKSSE